MGMCVLFEEQSKKVHTGKPHENLIKVDHPRIYKGVTPGEFKEQDYLCQTCKSKFSRSTNKNDFRWTLWWA
jgi:transposase-like protein